MERELCCCECVCFLCLVSLVCVCVSFSVVLFWMWCECVCVCVFYGMMERALSSVLYGKKELSLCVFLSCVCVFFCSFLVRVCVL